MPQFALPELLGRILAAAGITKTRFEEIAAEEAQKYPDLAAWEKAVDERVRTELGDSLNEETISGLIAGGIAELRSGHPGYNKHHFGGA